VMNTLMRMSGGMVMAMGMVLMTSPCGAFVC
jgi:hypothetical protein